MTESKATRAKAAAQSVPLQDTSNDEGTDWLGAAPHNPDAQQLATTPDLSDPVKVLLDYARANMMDDEEDTEAVYARMAAQLLQANTADEVFDSQDSTKAETVLGIPIWCTDVKVRESDEEFTEGLGYFAIIKGVRSDKRTECVISCGGWSVVMELIRIHMLHDLPQMMVVRQKPRKTKRGFYPLYIGRPM